MLRSTINATKGDVYGDDIRPQNTVRERVAEEFDRFNAHQGGLALGIMRHLNARQSPIAPPGGEPGSNAWTYPLLIKRSRWGGRT